MKSFLQFFIKDGRSTTLGGWVVIRWAHMPTRVCVCMCVNMHIYIHTHTHAHTHTLTHTRTHTHTVEVCGCRQKVTTSPRT